MELSGMDAEQIVGYALNYLNSQFKLLDISIKN